MGICLYLPYLSSENCEINSIKSHSPRAYLQHQEHPQITTPEKQLTTSNKQDSYIKCSTKLNALARSCSVRKLIKFLIIVPELMHYIFCLHNSFKGGKCDAVIKSSTFTSKV
jgi:hypothetical protein